MMEYYKIKYISSNLKFNYFKFETVLKKTRFCFAKKHQLNRNLCYNCMAIQANSNIIGVSFFAFKNF